MSPQQAFGFLGEIPVEASQYLTKYRTEIIRAKLVGDWNETSVIIVYNETRLSSDDLNNANRAFELLNEYCPEIVQAVIDGLSINEIRYRVAREAEDIIMVPLNWIINALTILIHCGGEARIVPAFIKAAKEALIKHNAQVLGQERVAEALAELAEEQEANAES